MKSPYYAILPNLQSRWPDSHKVGIDGPLMHLDEEDPSLLHLWILSFERHALIRHYGAKLASEANLDGPHPVVASIVLKLAEAQGFHEWRYVHSKAPAIAFSKSVPSTKRIIF